MAAKNQVARDRHLQLYDNDAQFREADPHYFTKESFFAELRNWGLCFPTIADGCRRLRGFHLVLVRISAPSLPIFIFSFSLTQDLA